MKKVNLFKLKFQDSKLEDYDQLSGELLFDNKATNIVLSGNCIKHQYQIENFYVLFTTLRDPLNEVLSIYLLNNRFNLLDGMQIYPSMPTSGGQTLENFKVIEPNKFYIDFLTVKPWKLTISLSPVNIALFTWRPFMAHRLNKSFLDKTYLKISHCKKL